MLSLDKFVRLLCISSLFPLVTSSCADLSPEYGMVNIKITSSQEVYFKREVSGQNYDALVLSPSKDLCVGPNPKSDYIFQGQGPHIIYYKVESGTLILFLTIEAALPEKDSFPIRVIQNKMHPLEFMELQENYRKLGLVELKVEIDRGLKCR